MIKTETQAKQVQKRRFDLNKPGYAKAVVRYFKRTDPKGYKTRGCCRFVFIPLNSMNRAA